MSYTPTNWESDDVVTATRMNALENAVGDMNMSYTPNTWVDGDVLTAAKMNALEQAVASGGGGGGGDVGILTLTVTVVNNSNSEVEEGDILDGFYNLYLIGSSGYIYAKKSDSGALEESILPSTTKTLTFGYKSNSGSIETPINSMLAYSDIVNLDPYYDEYYNEFTIVDNTENSSMTITIS